MSATLKEIAARANVSISTVSRVLNNKSTSQASKTTVENIWRLANELGYIPNVHAKNLANTDAKASISKNLQIGILLTDDRNAYTDSFFSKIMNSAGSEALKNNVKVKYVISNAAKNLYLEDYTGVDGIIMMGRTSFSFIQHVKTVTPNLVYAGMSKFGLDFDEVLCDAAQVTETLVNHVVGLGHKKIGYLGIVDPLANNIYNEHRFKAYKKALEENNIPLNMDYVEETVSSADSGYACMKKIISRNTIPSAILCLSDIATLGAVKAIKEAKLDIPGDISVVSIVNTDIVSYLSPSITSAKIPINEIGRIAFRVLLDRITQGHTIPLEIRLPFQIVMGESCISFQKNNKF